MARQHESGAEMSDQDQFISIDDIIPDMGNPRQHGYRSIHETAKSIREYGANRGIVIDDDGVVWAGNGVVQAAKEAGIDKVRVVDVDGKSVVAIRVSHLTEEQKRAYAIADNRVAELSTWDKEELLALFDSGMDLTEFWSEEDLSFFLDTRVYAPVLDPEMGHADVTDDDIAKAEAKMEEKFTGPTLGRMEYREKTCPSCHKTFTVRG